jgi:hypothetical protein
MAKKSLKTIEIITVGLSSTIDRQIPLVSSGKIFRKGGADRLLIVLYVLSRLKLENISQISR